ncbi:MAG: MTH1187 family thiamine-binding protein [Deltaproteobacteria bacterium]|nr:MTH1187 family thiamine-binding protein [Deltaproteobacteria bacterium]
MRVMVDFQLVPLGVGVSVSKYVAECEKIIQEAGLERKLHAFGTNISGEWDEVMACVKKCHEHIHQMGAPRITSALKIGTRTDRSQSIKDKLNSVTSKLEEA